MPKKSTRKLRRHVDRKLQARLRIYFILSIILFLVVIYEIVTRAVGIELSLIGIMIGIVLGIISARMYHLSWNHDAKKIISSLDMFGVLILATYIIISIFRAKIIGHFVHGSAVTGVSLAIAAGAMAGRVLGTRGKIIQILKEQKVF